MQQIMLLVTVATLLSGGCHSTPSGLRLLPKKIDLNSSERRSRDYKLTLTRRPEPVVPQQPGSPVELTCEAIGKPAPTVHWFKNDAPVYEHELESNEVIDVSPTSLALVTSTLLVQSTKREDKYTCLVVAGMKTIKASTTVYSTDSNTDLSERSKLSPLAPRILVSYKILMDSIGNTITLPCRAKGHPRPHVTWRNIKGELVKNDDRITILRSGELVISSLQWTDMGPYTCHAVNIFGSQTSTTFVYPNKAV